jgi:hypothetical protein
MKKYRRSKPEVDLGAPNSWRGQVRGTGLLPAVYRVAAHCRMPRWCFPLRLYIARQHDPRLNRGVFDHQTWRVREDWTASRRSIWPTNDPRRRRESRITPRAPALDLAQCLWKRSEDIRDLFCAHMAGYN